MSARLHFRQEEPRVRYIFSRRLFSLLVIHWALLVTAVPVFVFVSNRSVFSIYLVFGFLSFFILTFTKPTRYLFTTRGRVVCAELKRFSTVIRIIMIPLALLAIYGIFMLSEGRPRPSVDNGIYCIWNHGFIREISKEEYIRLSRIERTMFSSMLAFVRSGFMLCCCYADQIT